MKFDYNARYRQYVIAKADLVLKGMPTEEYEKELKKLIKKYRI